MNAVCVEVDDELFPAATMTRLRVFRAYVTEARYEFLRMLRVLGFSLPFLALPVGLFLLFGVVMFGAEVGHDPDIGKFLLTGFAVMGVMGPGMFAFGVSVATERENGLLTLKRALPAPRGSYLLAKMQMALLFAVVVMATMFAVALPLGHMHLSAAQCLSASAACILGSLPFCAIGLFLGTWTTTRSAVAVVNLIYVPMMHVSGLFYPLPKVMRTIAPMWPSYHLQQLVLRALGSSSRGQAIVHAAVLAGVTVVLGLYAVRRLERVG